MVGQFYLRHLVGLVTVLAILAGLIHAAFLSPLPFGTYLLLLGFAIYFMAVWFLRSLAAFLDEQK
jgi:hypothetical protein